jgi:cobalt-zinc-cadmium efflux system membrane fusion protein
MMHLHLRRGRLLLGGLIGLVAVAGAVGFFIFWPPPWHTSDAQSILHAPVEQISSVKREGTLLVVSTEVVKALGIETTLAKRATKPRDLPTLTGCLALDNNTLARIPPRFPGEVVSLGTIHGKEATELPPEGSLDGRLLRFGDRVEKGQLLAVLWSKDLGEKKSEFVDALVRLKYDSITLRDLEDLLKINGATSMATVNQARSAVQADRNAANRAENTLRSWRLKDADINALKREAEQMDRNQTRSASDFETWARMEIRAPQAGVIIEMNAALGSQVNDTGADLFKIVENRKLAVWAYIYEDDLPLVSRMLKQGTASATVKLPSQSNAKLAGTVDYIGEIIDPYQHTALLKGTVDNADGALKVGQNVTVHIELPPAADEIEIPTSALVEDGRDSIVFVQPDPTVLKFERRKVVVSRRFHDVVYLQQSLAPGERIVIGGALLLNDAMNE